MRKLDIEPPPAPAAAPNSADWFEQAFGYRLKTWEELTASQAKPDDTCRQ
jgi:hypothetical protein